MISTLVLSILLNGSPTKAFNAIQGLRQGDPLSPFLFILAAEGLRWYIKEKAQREQYTGLRLWGNDLPLTYQQFIDDIMMYGQASLKEARGLMEVLTDFTSASGMEINKEKFDIFFFNTTKPSQAFLAGIMGFRIGNFPTKYLGIQLNDQQNRVANWKPLLAKIQGKMQNWTFRSLNMLSRVILLRSMLQSIPISN